MPCYLFTYHAYRSWMPDQPRGFVRRKQGIQQTNEFLTHKYVMKARHRGVTFSEGLQQTLIDELLVARIHQRFRMHYVATETSHVHVLTSWVDDRPWMKIRSGIKSSMSRRLNREMEKQPWFGERASRRRVEDRTHFDHLVRKYLPRHQGWKWSESRGLFK